MNKINQLLHPSIRIGVTGHRLLPDIPLIEKCIRDVYVKIQQLLGNENADINVHILSPLAEGADRLVVQQATQHFGADKTILEAVLPMNQTEYLKSFSSTDAIAEFNELYDSATIKTEIPEQNDRHSAYELSGKFVVDNCDFLIAVWDGKQGRGTAGTANIKKYADNRGLYIFWIHSETGEIVDNKKQKNVEHLKLTLQRWNAYINEKSDNQTVTEKVNAFISKALEAFTEDAECNEYEEQSATAFFESLSWPLLSMHARAGLLARKYQKRVYRTGQAVYLLAALAIITVIVQYLFFRQYHLIFLIEVGLLLTALLLVLKSYLGSWQRKWIDYRFLAERLRALIPRKVVGLHRTPTDVPVHLELSHTERAWMLRCLTLVSAFTQAKPLKLEMAKSYVREQWIEDQRNYYSDSSTKLKMKRKLLSYTGYSLFGLTVLIGIAHAFHLFPQFSTEQILLAIALPAIGSALAGIEAFRDFDRLEARYSVLPSHLEEYATFAQSYNTMEELQKVVDDADEAMFREQQDWRILVRFHKIKTPA